MDQFLKKALIASVATIALSGCSTPEHAIHTESYKGGYYTGEIEAQAEHDDTLVGGISLEAGDFNYDAHEKVPAYTPDENSEAQQSYRYAMTMKDTNPQGMIEALYIASKLGSGDAHYELARELTSGVNLNKNPKAAQEHLNDGVALNHAEAYRVLGMMNIRGDNMPANADKGIDMLESAAKSSTRAARDLGYVYQGKAYPKLKDTDKAIKYLTVGYKKGDVQSAYLLGQTYHDAGRLIEAVEPLDFAAEKGSVHAKKLLANIK